MLFYDSLDEYVQLERKKLDQLLQKSIPEVGVILDVFGPSDDQDVRNNPGGHSVTQPVDQLIIDCYGIEGDRHRCLTRRSTPREAPLYSQTRVQIVNRRQLFATSPYECAVLSERLDIEVSPQLLGANLLIGREDGGDFSISELPVNTYLVIAPANATELPTPPLATLIHHVRQKGCGRTGRALAKAYDDESLTKRFVEHAESERGILCGVEYPVSEPAVLERGQKVFLKFPMGCCY